MRQLFIKFFNVLYTGYEPVFFPMGQYKTYKNTDCIYGGNDENEYMRTHQRKIIEEETVC